MPWPVMLRDKGIVRLRADHPGVQTRVQLLSQGEVSKVLPTGVFESRHIVGDIPSVVLVKPSPAQYVR